MQWSTSRFFVATAISALFFSACEQNLTEPSQQSLSSGGHPLAALTGTGVCTAAPLGSPLGGPLVAKSGYGIRYRSKAKREPSLHWGIDLRALTPTPVYAADAGVVTFSGWAKSNGGIMVFIEHGLTGRTTKYMHLSSTAVSVGQFVQRGEMIAMTGNTNGGEKHRTTTNPHLHFGYEVLGVDVDPMPCLPYTEMVQLSPASATMSVDETKAFTAVVQTGNGTTIQDRTILWHSLTPDIVSVDKNGVVTALANGQGQIKVSASLNTVTVLEITVGAPSFDGTYTDSWYIGDFLHTDVATVSGLSVSGSHSFSNGSVSGGWNWSGTITRSTIDPNQGTITGGGTRFDSCCGSISFTLHTGNIWINSDGTAGLFYEATDPRFGTFGSAAYRSAP